MALQVRFRHSMGDRLLEIPARPADRPFVLGRGSDSDLVVPSMSVALRQCALFVYDGQWAVEELTAGGTQLNNSPLDGPTLLHTGDVLTFGGDANAATLEINPGGAAAGRGGSPALDEARRPVAPSARPARRAEPQMPTVPGVSFVEPDALPPQPVWAPAVEPAPIEPTAVGMEDTADPADAGDAGWAAAFADPAPRRSSRRPKKRAPSSAPLVVAIILGLVIVGVTAWIVIEKMQPPPPVVVTPEPPPPAPSRPTRTSIFSDEDPAQPKAKPPDAHDDQSSPGSAKPDAAPSTPADPAPSPAGADESSDDQPDPKGVDPQWPGILAAHDNPDQAIALFRYADYRQQNPGKNEKILDRFEAEAVDLIWWQRITQLCHHRKQLADQIQEKQSAIDEETDASFKAKLVDEKASLEDDQKSTEDKLRNEMGFTEDEPPNINDDQAIAMARAARNPAKFAEWSKYIVHYVRSHDGATPWGNEDS